jgi:hypothetical protein
MKKFRGTLAAIMTAALCFSSMTCVSVAQAAEETSSEDLVLADCTDASQYGTIINDVTLQTNKQYTYKEAEASGEFKIKAGSEQSAKFTFENPIDLTEYGALRLRAYSPEATGDKLSFVIYDSQVEGSYFLGSFYLNWTGWQDVMIKIEPEMSWIGFSKQKGATNDAAVSGISISAGGWSVAIKTSTTLYIDSVTALKSARMIGDGDSLRKMFGASSGYTEQLAGYGISAPKLSVAAGKSGTLTTKRNASEDRLWSNQSYFQDVSGYKTLKANIYNTTLDASANVHLGVYTKVATGGNYYVYDVPLDWTGWKTVTVDLDKPAHTKLTVVTDTTDVQYNPRTHIESFAVNVGGWHTNSIDTVVYFDSVWFDADDGSNVILDAKDTTSITNLGLATTDVLGVQAANFMGTGSAIQKYNSKTFPNIGITKDWSGYDKLSMLVYANDYDEGDVLEVVPYVSGSAYYIYKLPIDWDGWKEIQIPLADFEQVGDISWSKIEKLVLSYGKYGGSKTSDSEDLSFEKIVLQKDGDAPLTGVVNMEKNDMGVYEISGTFLTEDSEVPYSVILAEKNEGLFGSASIANTASTKANRADIETTYTPSEANVKVMVWSGVESLKPVSAAFEK